MKPIQYQDILGQVGLRKQKAHSYLSKSRKQCKNKYQSKFVPYNRVVDVEDGFEHQEWQVKRETQWL